MSGRREVKPLAWAGLAGGSQAGSHRNGVEGAATLSTSSETQLPPGAQPVQFRMENPPGDFGVLTEKFMFAPRSSPSVPAAL
jgi:hypothetical protein